MKGNPGGFGPGGFLSGVYQPALLLLALFLAGTASDVLAEQQLSRQQYVEMFREDLLAPCHNPTFVACLDSSTAHCQQQVSGLIDTCSQQLPATITRQNFDSSADEYANCVFNGLHEAFGKSSEEIGMCETRAGLR